MDILEVEKNKCIGCGACISIDSEHFDFDDEGLSEVISNDNLKTVELQDAIDSCPTSAIRLAKTSESYESNIEDTNASPIGDTIMASKNETI